MNRILRRLCAVATLLLLLVGVPALLWQLGGNPVPSELSLQAITDALTQPDDGHLVLQILTWAGWIGWASFALPTLVEAVAQLRGVRAPRLPALQLQQTGARVLVATALGLIGTGSMAAGSAQAAPAATAPAATASTRAGTQPPAPSTITVAPGDTLSELAREHLGSARAWPRLYEASTGIAQPHGQRLRDPDRIQPGWHLAVPGPATQAHPAPEHEQPQPSAPSAAPTSPAPTPLSPSTRSSAEQAGSGTSTPAPQPRSVHPAPLTGVGTASEQHQAVAPLTGLAGVTAAGVLTLLAARRRTQTRRPQPGARIALPTEPEQTRTETHLRTDAAADPLAAEDLDLALRTLAHLTQDAGAEMPQLTAARIQPHQLELYLLDVEHQLPEPFTLIAPGIWAVPRAGLDDLLHPDQAEAIPAPYPALVTLGQDEESAWVLLHLEQVHALSVTGDHARPVLTAMLLELISSAWADDLRLTLVGLLPELADAFASDRVSHSLDLDSVLTSAEYAAQVHAGAMRQAGLADPSQARATQQLPDTWAPQLLVLAQPPTPQQTERLRALLQHTPRLSIAVLTTDAAPQLSDWTLQTDPEGQADLMPAGLRLRPQHIDADAYHCLVEIFRTTEQPDHAPTPTWAESLHPEPQLAQLPAPLARLALPAPAPAVEAPPTPTTPVSAPTAEPAVEATDGPATTQPQTPGSDEPDADPGAETRAHPPADDPEAHQAPHQLHSTPSPVDPSRPLVRLLGPIQIEHAPGKRPSSPGKATEIIAYLALHPSRSHEPLDAAIWPDKRMTAQQRNVPISNARSWLGTAPDGHPYLCLVDEHGYRLAPDTQVDWWILRDLIGDDIAATSNTRLQQALQLVSTTPLTISTRSRRSPLRSLAWAEADMMEMIQTIADVAHELSTRALLERDPTTAAWAAAKGLSVEPASEVLWRDALRAAWASNIPGRLQAVADQLTTALEPLGDLEPDTLDLLDDLRTRQHRYAS